MDESKPNFEGMASSQELSDSEKKKLEKAAKILILIEKIHESNESIPFPGIQPEIYSKMKKDEDEFPGYATPVDEIIERCKKEGIRVTLGKNPESNNVYILPASRADIERGEIQSDQLAIDAVENEHLRELIQLTAKEEE